MKKFLSTLARLLSSDDTRLDPADKSRGADAAHHDERPLTQLEIAMTRSTHSPTQTAEALKDQAEDQPTSVATAMPGDSVDIGRVDHCTYGVAANDAVGDDAIASEATGIERATAVLGNYPPQFNSTRAGVLRRLLEGEELSGMDAVLCAGTTRLSAHIGALIHEYGWPVETRDIAHPKPDGSVSTIRLYSLDPAVIAAAQMTGSRRFCDAVVIERAIQATKYAQAVERAAKANAAKKTRRKRKGGPVESDPESSAGN